MCSYFVSVRQPENCRTPPPPCLNFAKSTQMFQVILQSIFVRYLALQRRSTADASISHIPTPRRVRKSEHLPYISYQIPTPQWRFLRLWIWVSSPAPRLIANTVVLQPFLGGKSLFLINCGVHVSKAACRALNYAPFSPRFSEDCLSHSKSASP